MARHFTTATGLLATLLVTGAAYADTLFGVYAGAGVWQQGYSGDVAAGDQDVSLNRDLDLKDQDNNMVYLALEYGVPVLPNLRFGYTDVSTDGRNTLSRTVSFQGQQFTVSDDVSASLDLEQTDAIAYYEVLDNVLSLDVGLAARWVDGRVSMASDAGSSSARFQGVLPMLYARARADLPLTGLWVGSEAMGVSYDGHHLVDANAQVGWESPVGLGAELGWRTFSLELDRLDDVDNAKIDISGPYAAVNFHF